jgi:hypothetical protein
VGELVVGEAGAEGVDAAQPARPQRRQQQLSKRGWAAVRLGDLVGVEAAVEDVDLMAPAGYPGEETPAARLQLVGGDDRQAQLQGDPLVLVPGAVLGAVGEDDGKRLVASRRRSAAGRRRRRGRR